MKKHSTLSFSVAPISIEQQELKLPKTGPAFPSSFKKENTIMDAKRVFIQEVATRDGFQNEAKYVETDEKVSLINALSECGYAKVEVTSFTSPKAIPALRDAEAVMHRISRHEGVVYTVLVPNVRGAERALSCSVDEVNLVMSVSESHNRTNLRMSREQSFAQLSDVIGLVRSTQTAINVYLAWAAAPTRPAPPETYAQKSSFTC